MARAPARSGMPAHALGALALLMLLCAAPARSDEQPTVHTVFSTECTPYFGTSARGRQQAVERSGGDPCTELAQQCVQQGGVPALLLPLARLATASHPDIRSRQTPAIPALAPAAPPPHPHTHLTPPSRPCPPPSRAFFPRTALRVCGTDWQSLGMAFTHHLVGQPGRLTRLLACDGAALKTYAGKGRLALGAPWMETHVHPNFARHPSGDLYAPYNKPGSVDHWLKHADPPVTADYIIVADADMVLRKPLLPWTLGATQGKAVGAKFGYLRTDNYLCKKHVDANKQHLCSQCGGFVIYHREDLERVAPLWYKYTDVMRHDPDSWHDTGDAYCDGKHAPWISEMYGYMFGAAQAGVDHVTNTDFMMYPGYSPPERIDPGLLHYGLEFHVDAPGHNRWSFDKHAHTSQDMLECPGRLFEAPPDEAALQGLPLTSDTRGKLLVIENAKLLNAALEWHHNTSCGNPGSLRADGSSTRFHVPLPQKATELFELQATRARCEDKDHRCAQWASGGECQHNAPFMRSQCEVSCGVCKPRQKGGAAAGAGGLRGGGGGPEGAPAFDFAVRLPELGAAVTAEQVQMPDAAADGEANGEDVEEGESAAGGDDDAADAADEGEADTDADQDSDDASGDATVQKDFYEENQRAAEELMAGAAALRTSEQQRAALPRVVSSGAWRLSGDEVGGGSELFTGGAVVWCAAVLAFVCACLAPARRRSAGGSRVPPGRRGTRAR